MFLRLSNRTQDFFGSAGAGLFIICQEDNSAFLLKRSSLVNEPGTWGLPGGKIEPGEDEYSAAIRESLEELGGLPTIESTLDKVNFKDNNFTYTTFIVNISLQSKKSWTPILNWENTEYKWFPLTAMPSNLHFGVKYIQQILRDKRVVPPLSHEYDWVIDRLATLKLPNEILSLISDNLSNNKEKVNLKNILNPAIKYFISQKDINGIKSINYILKTEEKWNSLELSLPKQEQSAISDFLYHGTNALDAASILKSKTFLKASAFDRVSLTSDLASAAKFGDIVLVFDGKKLQRKGAKKMRYISQKQQQQLLKSIQDYELHGEDGKNPKISDIYKYEKEWYLKLPFSFENNDLIKIIILKRYSSLEDRERIKKYFEEITDKPIEIVQAASYFPTSKESSPDEISIPLVDLRDSLVSGAAYHAYNLIDLVRKELSSLDKDSIEYYDFKRDIVHDANAIFRSIQEYDQLFKPNYTFNVKLDTNLINRFIEKIKSNVESLRNEANRNSKYSKIAEHAEGLLTSLRQAINYAIKSIESDDFYKSLLKDYSSTYHFVFKDKLVRWIEANIQEVINLIRENDLKYSNSYGNQYASIGDFLRVINNVNSIPVDIWRRFPLSLIDNDNFYQYPTNNAIKVVENNKESSLLSKDEIYDFIIKNRIPYLDGNNSMALMKLLEGLGYSLQEKE